MLGDIASGLQIPTILVVAGDGDAGLFQDAANQGPKLFLDGGCDGIGDNPLVRFSRVSDGVIDQPAQKVQRDDLEFGVLDEGMQRRSAREIWVAVV